MSDVTAKRQMKAILEAAHLACSGDVIQITAALIGAIGVHAARHKGAVQILGLAIETLQRAQAELETGVPMLKIDRSKPS